jgi:hypothetical protein
MVLAAVELWLLLLATVVLVTVVLSLLAVARLATVLRDKSLCVLVVE